jgi:hypothetical protein
VLLLPKMSSEQKQEGGVGDVDRQFEEKSEPQTGVGAFEFETPYGSSRYGEQSSSSALVHRATCQEGVHL